MIIPLTISHGGGGVAGKILEQHLLVRFSAAFPTKEGDVHYLAKQQYITPALLRRRVRHYPSGDCSASDGDSSAEE